MLPGVVFLRGNEKLLVKYCVLNFEQNRECKYPLILTLMEKLKPLIVGVVLLHAWVRKVFYQVVEADSVVDLRGEFSKHAFLLV